MKYNKQILNPINRYGTVGTYRKSVGTKNMLCCVVVCLFWGDGLEGGEGDAGQGRFTPSQHLPHHPQEALHLDDVPLDADVVTGLLYSKREGGWGCLLPVPTFKFGAVGRYRTSGTNFYLFVEDTDIVRCDYVPDLTGIQHWYTESKTTCIKGRYLQHLSIT